MRKLIPLACILMFVVPALADWEPADGHKMHFPQLPDPEGWDVYATAPAVAADDWQCSEAGEICDIHFWGSWKDDVVGTIEGFVVTIHANVPGPPSMPGEVLWEQTFEPDDWVEVEIEGPPEGWYDPGTGEFFPANHIMYYQYNISGISDPFVQEVGLIYWLSISAQVAEEPPAQWGWKSSVEHFMDDAVWAPELPASWVELYEPPAFTQSLDLAFVITGNWGACVLPGGDCVEVSASECDALPGKWLGACEPCLEVIPAVTEWGLLVMVLIGLAAGTIMFRKARAVTA